jgi:hypothetical protein
VNNTWRYLRHVLIGELAQLILEVSLLLLELIEVLLAFFELVPHFDLDSTRLVDLSSLLVQLFLDHLELFFACLKCLYWLSDVFPYPYSLSTYVLRLFGLLLDPGDVALLSCHVVLDFFSFDRKLFELFCGIVIGLLMFGALLFFFGLRNLRV